MREEGYYKVKYRGGEPSVARWISQLNCWAVTGTSDKFYDEDFGSIGDKIEL